MIAKSHCKSVSWRVLAYTILAILLSSACTPAPTPVPAAPTSTPMPTPTPDTRLQPVLDQDFPDPDVLKVGDAYYAYATNANDINFQIAWSPDLVHWEMLGDALPTLPAWAVQKFGWAWAPEVFSPSEGRYVMYFTARRSIGFDGTQCIGVATADDPAGPFVSAAPQPLICQISEGGSIDPASFVDADGQRYILWKNDGNSGGGQTWLYIQKTSADGLTLEGELQRLLTADQPWEGVLVEAPTLWLQNGKYFLFYSANAYNDQRYATGYAVADTILGPYVKVTKPFLATDLTASLVGPGGQDIVIGPHGGTWILFHGWAPEGYRRLYLAALDWENGTPILQLNSGREP
ncbi:MAG: glycoside hydrolase family 43 protein [Anaerolineales bacterium]